VKTKLAIGTLLVALLFQTPAQAQETLQDTVVVSDTTIVENVVVEDTEVETEVVSEPKTTKKPVAKTTKQKTTNRRNCATSKAPRDYPGGWDRLAQKESGGNWSLNVGLFDGGLQFTVQTWRAFRGCAGVTAAYAHQASKAEQIAVARYTLAAQGSCAWPLSSKKLGVASCGY
jgi:ribosomal protein L21